VTGQAEKECLARLRAWRLLSKAGIYQTKKEESALDVSFVRLGAPSWLVFLENSCKDVQATLSMACPSQTTLYIGQGTDPGRRDETGGKRVPGTPAGIGVYFQRLEFTERLKEESALDASFVRLGAPLWLVFLGAEKECLARLRALAFTSKGWNLPKH
jgi:hypothetical protein